MKKGKVLLTKTQAFDLVCRRARYDVPKKRNKKNDFDNTRRLPNLKNVLVHREGIFRPCVVQSVVTTENLYTPIYA